MPRPVRFSPSLPRTLFLKIMVHAVIMAGGIGSRFWPRSRRATPKQFLNVFGDSTMIQATIQRLSGVVKPEHCHVVTNGLYADLTRKQLPALPGGNVMGEPIARNTAPCIAYAAMKLVKQDPDAIMVVLPADHRIGDVRAFHDVLAAGIEKAGEYGALVTIGIEPTHPATGYGYIQFDTEAQADDESLRAYFVKTFAEKPNQATAERFIDSGDFLWNSGMFMWRAESILDAIAEHLPDVWEAFEPISEHLGTDGESAAVEKAYRACPSISIDYGVMERAAKVYVVPGDFDWNDVGDWKAVYDLSDKGPHGNAITGNGIVHDSGRCLVQASERLVALVGVHDLIVVDTDDAVLVCHRDAAQGVKNIVDYLYAHQLDDYV